MFCTRQLVLRRLHPIETPPLIIDGRHPLHPPPYQSVLADGVQSRLEELHLPGMQMNWGEVSDSLRHSIAGFNSARPAAGGRPRRATESNLVVLERNIASQHGIQTAAAAVSASSSLRPPPRQSITIRRPGWHSTDGGIRESVVEDWPGVYSSERPTGSR